MSPAAVGGVAARSAVRRRSGADPSHVMRVVDVVVSAALLVGSAPVMAAVALAVRCSSPGPVLHRGRRCGRGGREFEILKFRSMVADAAARGPGITGGRDPRITRVGGVLRRTKLDELPQLWNVLRGDMALVGPRPEDPRYVALWSEEQRRVLSVRPGITGAATVAHRHEEQLLADADDVEATYREVVMPAKLALDLEWLDRRTVAGDLRILVRTVAEVVSIRGAGSGRGRS